MITGSTGSTADTGGEGVSAGAAPHRVVISSLTGRPIAWKDDSSSDRRDGAGPIVPDRAAEDAPEPGQDTSNDDRLTRDVPPHWGTGS